MKKVPCPNCSVLTEYSTNNPFRPFCCERCKMLDLGAWANESYRLSDNSTTTDNLAEPTLFQDPDTN